jgi:hypothetical protein
MTVLKISGPAVQHSVVRATTICASLSSSTSSKPLHEKLTEWLKYIVFLKLWVSIRSSHSCVEEHYHFLTIINLKKRKVKVVPVHAMKAHRGSKGIAPLVLNIGVR